MTDLFSLLESWTFKMRHKPAEHVISRLAHVCITRRQRRHGEAQATLFHELSTVHLVICEAKQFCQRTLFCFRTADLSKWKQTVPHRRTDKDIPLVKMPLFHVTWKSCRIKFHTYLNLTKKTKEEICQVNFCFKYGSKSISYWIIYQKPKYG